MPGLRSVFKSPEGGVAAGIGTAVAVYLIYNSSLPTGADMRMGEPHDQNIESARKGAAWKSAGLIGLVFLITRDLNTFIISGAALTGVDYLAKHHNGIDSETGKLQGNEDNSAMPSASLYPMPQYAESVG